MENLCNTGKTQGISSRLKCGHPVGSLPVDRLAQKSFNANIDVSLSDHHSEFCHEFCCCSLLASIVYTNSFGGTLVNFNYFNYAN